MNEYDKARSIMIILSAYRQPFRYRPSRQSDTWLHKLSSSVVVFSLSWIVTCLSGIGRTGCNSGWKYELPSLCHLRARMTVLVMLVISQS